MLVTLQGLVMSENSIKVKEVSEEQMDIFQEID